jgi:hypothetical protein
MAELSIGGSSMLYLFARLGRPRYGPGVDSAPTPTRIDGVDLRETEDDVTLLFSAEGAGVMSIRLRYDGMVDEVGNSAGMVATWAVNSWTLIGRDLSLEYDARSAATLGFPDLHSLFS